MNDSLDAISESDLHAYVDGVLDPGKVANVEAYLAAHPEETKRLQDYRRLTDILHQGYDPVLSQGIPQGFDIGQSRVFGALRQVAAAAAMLTIGAILGWSLKDQAPITPVQISSLEQGLVKPAAVAHAVFAPEVRHPVEVTADQETHLSNWLSKRLGTKLKPPHLGEVGFELVGGRLLPGNDGPAAQFMYQDSSGKRLTLYLRQLNGANEATAFRYSVEADMGVFYWVDGKMGYALIGDLPKSDLLHAAEKTYQGLNF